MSQIQAKRVYLQNENDEILLPYSAQALEDGEGNVITDTYAKIAEIPSLDGKLNTDHSNDTKPYIKETYVNGTSGYNIWSNGYCEQWGRVPYGTIGNVTVTLLKQMRDIDYCCQVTLYGDTAPFTTTAGLGYWQAWNMTTSSFQTYRYNAATIQQMWQVSGYLAEGQY